MPTKLVALHMRFVCLFVCLWVGGIANLTRTSFNVCSVEHLMGFQVHDFCIFLTLCTCV